MSSELLQAVQDSHCWLLLLTPNFVKDDWCSYQMHQVLSEGPMSQRIIPAVVNMPRSQLPLELRFLFTVDLNTSKDFGYTQVYKAVLQCEYLYLHKYWRLLVFAGSNLTMHSKIYYVYNNKLCICIYNNIMSLNCI